MLDGEVGAPAVPAAAPTDEPDLALCPSLQPPSRAAAAFYRLLLACCCPAEAADRVAVAAAAALLLLSAWHVVLLLTPTYCTLVKSYPVFQDCASYTYLHVPAFVPLQHIFLTCLECHQETSSYTYACVFILFSIVPAHTPLAQSAKKLSRACHRLPHSQRALCAIQRYCH